MVNLFEIFNFVHTRKDLNWITEIPESDIKPYLLQRVLIMHDDFRVHARFLDKYVFTLSPRMFLSLMWSILPKKNKPPYAKYIKLARDNIEYGTLLPRVRKYLELSDNDWRCCESRIIKDINQHTEQWFKFFGVEKVQWKKYGKNFDKAHGLEQQSDLGGW